MPVLVLAQLHAAAEASHAEVKIAADGTSYPDSVGDVLAAWIAMVFNTRLCYCGRTVWSFMMRGSHVSIGFMARRR